MSRRDDSLDDDPDNPDPADTDDSESADDQDLLERCPSCRRMVYADAERCPYCGEYVTPGGSDRRPWLVVVIVLLVLAFLLLALR